MNLKNQVEWALHCCALLAGMPAARYLSTKTLAEFHGLPKEYLSKALQSLSQAGLVTTTLGPSGGYRLARSPVEITFLDIVEAVEGKRTTFICNEIRCNNPCRAQGTRDSKPCPIARIMWDADAAWRNSLAGVSLADLAKTLAEDIPNEQLMRNMDWLMERSG